uniref:Beta-glucosidase n=1 Tax=Knipowitschia caucasica TaxID=637954 RepID=A0AAV2JUK6_KNICA
MTLMLPCSLSAHPALLPPPPSLRAPLPPSSVPSASSAVWQSFSPRTEFQTKKFHYGSFPADFLWGVQSSAYQVEGGWDADGKGASVWDTFTQRNSSGIPEKATGNVACDSYNRLDQDLELIQASGVSAYSFSLSWARLFPRGDGDHNPAGVQYYNSLVDGLLRLKVVPVVSLHHWDLPQSLQDHGGWRNRSMVHLFTRYADFCYRTFGDRVKLWITINDPLSLAWRGYGTGEFPPGVKDPGVTPYHVAHTLLLAHAGAYHAYTPYRVSQGGSVSIALRGDWYEPLDLTVPRELEAADRGMQFTLGWFAHPIFRNGDYPEAMKEAVGNKSELQRLKETRLPVFSEQEMLQVRGSADVFCLIHQTTRIAKYSTQRLKPASYLYDRDLTEAELTDYPQTEVPGQRAVSWGLRRVLAWVRDEYGDPEVYVTENGVSTKRDEGDEDTERVFFIQTYINEALKAQSLDGVKLRGYLGAPLMDSFEWLQGYIVGQGLHQVDFTKPERPRTMKTSAHAYRTIVQNNGFPPGRDQTPIYGFFREDMMWSTATASYQIEGAWRADGKGLSIWDTFAHTPLRVSDDDTGDVACDSYHRYEEDVRMLKELGVGFYRFSIAWSRVLPDGTTAHVNEPGLQYYERLVDALLREGIKPQVTLYHWDLPQSLQDVGGWENVTVVQRFTEYADLMFSRLGDKVKFWITINEPYIISNVGHGYGAAAPGISFRPGTLPYIVGHHLLKSHAEAWHLYDQKYRPTQKGQISITLNSDWAEPRNPSKQEDHDAARRMVEFQLGWFAHPVFVGDYSPLMKTIIGNRSLAAGLPKSRLPEFTPEEIIRIRGTHDYFGFNHYTTKRAYPLEYGNLQHYDGDRSAGTLVDRAWLDSGSGWLKVTPFGFRRILNFIKENYGDPPVVVTENGVSQREFNMNDELRQHYYQEYTNQLLKGQPVDCLEQRLLQFGANSSSQRLHQSGQERVQLQEGEQYVVLDSGGGTIDITDHEVLEGEPSRAATKHQDTTRRRRVTQRYNQCLREFFCGGCGEATRESFQEAREPQEAIRRELWCSHETRRSSLCKSAFTYGYISCAECLSSVVSESYQSRIESYQSVSERSISVEQTAPCRGLDLGTRQPPDEALVLGTRQPHLTEALDLGTDSPSDRGSGYRTQTAPLTRLWT